MSDKHEPGSLGQWIADRAGELRLPWEDLADAVGVSTTTLRSWRKGSNIRNTNKIRLEEALNWARGSVDSIFAGGGPTPLAEAEIDSGEIDAEMLEALRFQRRCLDPAISAEDLGRFMSIQLRLWRAAKPRRTMWITWDHFTAEEEAGSVAPRNWSGGDGENPGPNE